MRIYYTYHGQEQFRDVDRKEILIGRLSPLSAPDIDLGDDPTVSRKHCRIKLTANGCVLEDLRSTNGSVVDNEAVESATITPSSGIRLGETLLRVELDTPPVAAVSTAEAPPPAAPVPPAKRENPMNPPPSPKPSSILPPKGALGPKPVSPAAPPAEAQAKPVIPTGGPKPFSKAPSAPSSPPPAAPAAPNPVVPAAPAKPATPTPRPAPKESSPVSEAKQPTAKPAPMVVDEDFRKALVALFEVPLSAKVDTRLDDLLKEILTRVLKLLPGAKDGAILINNEASGHLEVKASIPETVVVSDKLARRVMDEGHGFILERNVEDGSDSGPKAEMVETGMYAPLLSQEKAIGAIYVDDPDRETPYSENDMQFLLAVSHYVATVVHNQALRSGLAHNSTMLNRIEAKFPESVQERLVNDLRDNKLKPAGAKDDLPVLHAELVGFQSAGSEMPVEAATEMLGAYFSAIQSVIFKYDGTIDRFSGDGIVVAFGAPDADEKQCEKSVVAAIAIRDAVKDLNVKRVQNGGSIWHIKVGVNLGTVFHGFVGTTDQMTFALVGPGQFRAKGFCKGAENGEILIGPELFQKVFKIIDAERSSVNHKDFGEFHCYRVKGVKQK